MVCFFFFCCFFCFFLAAVMIPASIQNNHLTQYVAQVLRYQQQLPALMNGRLQLEVAIRLWLEMALLLPHYYLTKVLLTQSLVFVALN